MIYEPIKTRLTLHITKEFELTTLRESEIEMNYFGGSAVVNPRAPSRGIRLADVVRQILDARPRSGDDAFQEFQHRFSSGDTPPAVYRRRSIWRFVAGRKEGGSGKTSTRKRSVEISGNICLIQCFAIDGGSLIFHFIEIIIYNNFIT